VPTISYCFFVICHDRRRILHFNITKHPTSSWIYTTPELTPETKRPR
jgi:hypothetical protein